MNIEQADGKWILSREAYEICGPCMYRPDPERYGEEMAALLKREDCRVFVCTDAGERIGIIALQMDKSGAAQIRALAVRPSRRRRGAGTFAVRAAALYMRAERVLAETDGAAAGFYRKAGFSVRSFMRRFPDGDAVRYACELDMETLPGLAIRPTGTADLDALRCLWADGEVMKYVGFPEGIEKSRADMEEWLSRIEAARPRKGHYALYFRGVYCGESYYGIDGPNGRTALDIKLFPFARGRGIAEAGLRHAIGEAFRAGAVTCYVDPNPENERAVALYRRCGMSRKEMPEDLRDPAYPGFLYFEIGRPQRAGV